MTEKIVSWKEIEDEFNGAILLGNGASISVDGKFDYRSLKQHAIDKKLITNDVKSIFDSFKKNDFEFILRILRQANNVNKALKIDDNKTESSYKQVRDLLIFTVRHIHPEYDKVVDKIELICNFIKKFDFIFSLNYDLLTYWAIMYSYGAKDHEFRDCFNRSKFNDNLQEYQKECREKGKKCSFVFYPHGNLVLARDEIENEKKISADKGKNLLEKVIEEWEEGGCIPLFVSEGTSEQKLKSIQNSYYLSTVYKVLTSFSDNLTIYGWAFGEHDRHILDRIKLAGIKRVAVSVYKDDQAFCSKARKILKEDFGEGCKISFFDSESKGCWNHP